MFTNKIRNNTNFRRQPLQQRHMDMTNIPEDPVLPFLFPLFLQPPISTLLELNLLLLIPLQTNYSPLHVPQRSFIPPPHPPSLPLCCFINFCWFCSQSFDKSCSMFYFRSLIWNSAEGKVHCVVQISFFIHSLPMVMAEHVFAPVSNFQIHGWFQ
jgi:hypothetical protein